MRTKIKHIIIKCMGLLILTVIFPKIAHAEVYKKLDENGFPQIEYKNGDNIVQITNDNFIHAEPVTDDNIIVWTARPNSLWQLYYYDIKANYKVQLTRYGNNVNPQILGKYVVWEGQRNGIWQILMFDGVRVTQISDGIHPSQDVSIKDDLIVYSQKNAKDQWELYMYSIVDSKTTKISDEIQGRKPEIKENVIRWQAADPETGETKYYNYNVTTKKINYEGKTNGRVPFITKLEKELAELKSKKKIQTKPVKRTVIQRPEEPETEEVTEDDIIQEMELEGIISLKESEVRESTESASEVKESTSSNN